MISLADLWRCWRRFFFEPSSPAVLCIFRIAFGIVVLESALIGLLDLDTWYGPNGVLSLQLVKSQLGSKCLDLLLFLPPNDFSMQSLYAVYLLSALGVALGLFTRISSIALYLCISTLHYRNPIVINNGDDLMRVFAFFLMFAPAGAAFSLDNLFRKKTGKISPEKISPWPVRLMQLQITFSYFLYFWSKSGPTWWDGTAVYYVLANPQLEHFPWPLDRTNIFVSRILTWGTLVIEFFLWNLIWIKQFRYCILTCGLCLHLGLEYALNIPVFQHVIFCGYILFVFPEDMEKLLSHLGANPHIRRIKTNVANLFQAGKLGDE